jgi:uncharacterized membrane protein (DUF373 family)
MKPTDKFSIYILGSLKYLLKALVIIMTVSILLGMINLIYLLFYKIISPPIVYMLDLNDLYGIFKLSLIILVGYELIKSLLIIINSHTIPSKTILNIAIIAVANKIITLDITHTEYTTVLALAALALALGASNYFLKNDLVEE